MLKRLTLTLPIIAVMIIFVAPANAVTLPGICSKGKWVSCGSNAYYCTAMKGDSCKNPTFVAPRAMENWSQKQATSTKVAVGKTVSSSSVKKVTYKYVWRYKYVIKNHKKMKSWYKVKVAVK